MISKTVSVIQEKQIPKFFASFPNIEIEHPFIINWANALEEHNWHLKTFIWWPISLLKYRKTIRILVFHFPNTFWRRSNLPLVLIHVLIFRLMFLFGKSLGYKFVWGAHNLLPHDPKYPKVEIAQRKWILKNFDLVIGFAKNTKEDIEINFGPLNIPYLATVLGHYEGLYKTDFDVLYLIKKYYLNPGKYRLLLIISDKNYKGHEKLLRAWSVAKTDGLQLIVAGAVPKALKGLIDKLTGDVIAVFQHGRIPHNAIAELYKVSDIVLLPYQKITTSGAFFLSVTLSCPVFAPNLPFFRDHMGDYSGLGLLYESNGGETAIAEALESLSTNPIVRDEETFIRLRQEYNWRKYAHTVAASFESLL